MIEEDNEDNNISDTDSLNSIPSYERKIIK